MFKFNSFCILFLLTVINIAAQAQSFMAGGRVHLPPISKTVAGVSKPLQSLDGIWQINMKPNANAVSDIAESSAWQSIQVPGEAMMQGFKIKIDTAFVYRKKLNITPNTQNNRHIIRFNGVYNHAIVYCNGSRVREHFGGFTAWDADITDYIKPGQDNWLHVAVTDRADDISYASGYAHHPIGGILREVQYLVLPKNPVEYLYANTGLTNHYKDGTLSIKLSLPASANATIQYELKDASGKKIWAKSRALQSAGNNKWNDSLVIPAIKTWTAETPNLYTLSLTVFQNGKLQQTIEQKIGFRSVEIDAQKQILINGNSVKLRGACRHDMHPLLGRSTNRAQDSLDVVLAKESNMNFIRTSHYPPSKDFLGFCDQLGVYVQEETAICFVNDWREGVYKKYGESQDSLPFTDRYLGQLSEMIDRDRNHAAVIMWSIGNESSYGTNFQKSYDFIKTIDLSRPVSWSWPYTALDKGKRCFDIAVSHYPVYSGEGTDMGGIEKKMVHPDYPILGDEWAHVACYNTDLMAYDPNVKDFWGISMDTTWMNRFDVKGNIGGAIWGMIDETFHLKDTVTGYGPWGIVDVWRRKKPEFWNTKKAYSPIRLMVNEVKKENNTLLIPIHNRFDHLNLKNIKATVNINGKTTALALPDVAAHARGTIRVTFAEELLIQFKDQHGNLIDEEKFGSAKPLAKPAFEAGAVWTVTKKDNIIELKNKQLSFAINENTGAILYAEKGNELLISGNPLLVVNKPQDAGVLKNTPGIFSGDYTIQSAVINDNNKSAIVITTKGLVDLLPVEMATTLHATGLIEISYKADSIPSHTWDIGVGIPVNNNFNKISWERKGYWTTYPANHISGIEGSASKTVENNEQYRTLPNYDVANAMHDYYLNKTIDASKAKMLTTESYRGRKENIYTYVVSGNDASKAVTVWSDGTQAAKMNVKKDGSQQLLVTDKWDYWSLSWGNYQGKPNPSRKAEGTITIQL